MDRAFHWGMARAVINRILTPSANSDRAGEIPKKEQLSRGHTLAAGHVYLLTAVRFEGAEGGVTLLYVYAPISHVPVRWFPSLSVAYTVVK
jgi:hypothetical protein